MSKTGFFGIRIDGRFSVWILLKRGDVVHYRASTLSVMVDSAQKEVKAVEMLDPILKLRYKTRPMTSGYIRLIRL